MRSASKHSYASGALRAPGASTTSRTPRLISSSMITRAHAVALPMGAVLSLSKGQLPRLHETSLPEPPGLVVGPVVLERRLVNGQITHLHHSVHRDQWLLGQILGGQSDRVEPACVRQVRQSGGQRQAGPDPDGCLQRTRDNNGQANPLGNLQADSYPPQRCP